MCSVNADMITFISQNCIFSLLYLNQDFFITIMAITLLFGDLVDNVHLEGTMSQHFDLSPSFHFMTKNR